MFTDIGFTDDDDDVQRVIVCVLGEEFYLFCQPDDSRHLFFSDAHVVERDHNLGNEVIRITLVTAPLIYLVHFLTLKQFDVVITENNASD